MSLKIKTLSGRRGDIERCVAFRLYGKPVGKGRPRYTTAGGFGRMYTPKPTRDYERTVAEEYRLAKGWLMERPVMITVMQCFPIPKGASKKEAQLMRDYRIVPSCKPDIDNVLKVVLDGLNGVAYRDDTQVVCVVSERCYADNPCVEVIVEEIDAEFRRKAKAEVERARRKQKMSEDEKYWQRRELGSEYRVQIQPGV